MLKNKKSFNFEKFAVLSAKTAYKKKAENIKLLNIAKISGVADYVLIVTVDSRPHLDAVEQAISKDLKKENLYKLHHDGQISQIWRVLDYGGLIIHITVPHARSFYNLDKIYYLGKEVKWRTSYKKTKTMPKKNRRK